MKNYPRLKEMGILNPQEIEKFSVYATDNLDVLRIIYARKKGSLLPVSKNFKFSRIKKPVVVDSGTRQTENIYESNPAFREALSELEDLKTAKSAAVDLSEVINEEIRLLEEDMKLRIEYIKSLVKRV